MPTPDHPAGYLSDTTYPDRFHRELSPAWLRYVTVHGGAPPRDLDGHFTYLDLGSGFAHSTIVNAGAFPKAEFHACDFNPAHIEAAVRHASQLGVGNIQFHQTLFDELLTRDLPAFDFIVLHGIYTWVAADVRRTIQQIVFRKLKPGGLVYVSYNCLPGWAAEAPLRKLMLELARDEAGDAEQRARLALEGMQRLGNASFKYFRDNPATLAAVEAFGKDPTNYVAHEFLNATWKLFYSVDVADDMASAGASYLGSATLADNHPMLLIDKQAGEAVAKLPSARLRQLAMDYAVNQRFRRDVFIGDGVARATGPELLRNLDDAVIGCVTDVEQIGTQAIIPRGKITFQPDFVRELRALMKRGAMRIGDIVEQLGGVGRNPIEIRQNLVFLVAAGTLMPFAKAAPRESGATPARVVNPVVANALRGIVETGAPAVVPCEWLGNGVLVGAPEATQATTWLAGGADGPPSRLVRLGLLGSQG